MPEPDDQLLVINLTPHAVVVIAGTDELISFPPAGSVARCTVDRVEQPPLPANRTQLPFAEISYGDVEDLPPQRDGVVYLVSVLAALASDRSDLVVVDEEVRDEDGRIIGCRRLARLRRPDP